MLAVHRQQHCKAHSEPVPAGGIRPAPAQGSSTPAQLTHGLSSVGGGRGAVPLALADHPCRPKVPAEAPGGVVLSLVLPRVPSHSHLHERRCGLEGRFE